jgi:hypothetical protein
LLKTQQGPHLALGFAGCSFLAFKGVGNATVRTSPIHENKRPRSGTASPEKPTVQALPSKYDMEVSTIEQYSGLDLASVNAVPLRVLVTGFGSFPGTRDNPTALLVHALGGHRARLARLGVELETDVLPVNYAGMPGSRENSKSSTKRSSLMQFCISASPRGGNFSA